MSPKTSGFATSNHCGLIIFHHVGPFSMSRTTCHPLTLPCLTCQSLIGWPKLHFFYHVSLVICIHVIYPTTYHPHGATSFICHVLFAKFLLVGQNFHFFQPLVTSRCIHIIYSTNYHPHGAMSYLSHVISMPHHTRY